MVLEATINQTISISKGWGSLSLPLNATLYNHATKETDTINIVVNIINSNNIIVSLDLTNRKGQNTLTIGDNIGFELLNIIIKIKPNATIKERT